jgi:hypothetical protein
MSALQYARRWSRKDLHAISCISLNTIGSWLAVADRSSLLVFDADDGSMAIEIQLSTAVHVTSIFWISATSMICCCIDGTIMTVTLREVSMMNPNH